MIIVIAIAIVIDTFIVGTVQSINSFEGIVGYLKSRNFNYFLIILDRSIAYHYNIAIVYLIQL